MEGITVKINDNVQKVLEELDAKIYTALARCGREAAERAAALAPIETGELKQSMTYQIKGDTAYIGSNVEYAAYVELGTGKYYPGGRKTPWTYQDGNGEWHMTNGQRAQPFLKPAIEDNLEQYRAIIKDEFSK